MTECCETLRAIGAQKIHEDTHISKLHVQAVIDENFESMKKVQFLGFLSILEREYDLDLSVLKTNGLGFFEENLGGEQENSKVFVAPKKEKRSKPFYLTLLLTIFAVGAYVTLEMSSTKNGIIADSKENKIIEEVKKTIESEKATKIVAQLENNVSDANVTVLDLNETANDDLNETKSLEVKLQETKEEPKSFKIIAKSKVWVGYVEVSSNRKYQKTVSDELSLDGMKEWIFVFGHSHVKLEVNDEDFTFESKGNLRLWYKDGELKQISSEEFKSLNKGRKW